MQDSWTAIVDDETLVELQRRDRRSLRRGLAVSSFHEFATALEGADVSVLEREILDFTTGDLKQLCNDKGLVDGSKYHCLWCKAKVRDRGQFFRLIASTIKKRTDASLPEDYIQYSRQGTGTVDGVNAKQINKTPLKRTVPAPLHVVSLGAGVELFKKLKLEFDMLDELDEVSREKTDQLARQTALVAALEDTVAAKKEQKKEAKKLMDASKTEADSKKRTLPDNLQSGQMTLRRAAELYPGDEAIEEAMDEYFLLWNTYASNQGDYSEATAEVEEAKRELEIETDTKRKIEREVKKIKRPHGDAMNSALHAVGIDLGRYFGGQSLAGEKSHVFLKKRVQILDDALKNVDAANAKRIRDKFLPLMELLSEINSDVRRAEVLSEQKMKTIEENIKMFCDLYRMTFATTFTPKLHVLEAHYVERMPASLDRGASSERHTVRRRFMRTWHVLGLLAEDAIETLHAKMNRLAIRARTIRDKIKRATKEFRLVEDSQIPDAVQAAKAHKKKRKREQR